MSDRIGFSECWMRQYQDQILSYARRLTGNHADAQEIVQETFLRAHRALTERYSEERIRDLSPRPWLFRIAHNLALNLVRSRRGRREESLSDPHATELVSPLRPGSEPGRRPEIDRMEDALRGLDRGCRAVVLLRFMEEMSYGEIAAVLGTSEAAVRGRVFRALRRLRRLLEESEGDNEMQRGRSPAGRLSNG
jgi:RNA polymerase sigma-70 factor (ECF subfamily)